MGITKTDCTFLFHAKKLGVDYTRSCMLGRLTLYASHEAIEGCIRKYRNQHRSLAEVQFTDGYSEPLFAILGAQTTDSIDYSDYEKASIIHDLNMPLPDAMRQRFTCITDGGTIEHVFNFPVAIKSCMDSLAVGGHYIGITPANNSMGHGFYQFSPELIFRIFSEENGFRIKQMLISADPPDESTPVVWYEVSDPMNVKERVMLVNSVPLTIRFIAEKIAQKEVFARAPQQSVYATTWNRHASIHSATANAGNDKGVRMLIKRILPTRLKTILRNLSDILTKEKLDTRDLGVVDKGHYRQVEI